jgi:hypothetical protein
MVRHGMTNVSWEEHKAFIQAMYADMSKMDQEKLEEFLQSRSNTRRMALSALYHELSKVQGVIDARRNLQQSAKDFKK